MGLSLQICEDRGVLVSRTGPIHDVVFLALFDADSCNAYICRYELAHRLDNLITMKDENCEDVITYCRILVTSFFPCLVQNRHPRSH